MIIVEFENIMAFEQQQTECLKAVLFLKKKVPECT
jgi:hypothetical protein